MPALASPYDGVSAEMAIELLNSYRLSIAGRDRLIRAAFAAGLTRTQIYIHSGIARTTINRALEASDD